MTAVDFPENMAVLAALAAAGYFKRPEPPTKPMEFSGYIGSSEPQPDGSFHGRLLEIQGIVTYWANDRAGLEKSFRAAVKSYLESCEERGCAPDLPPEPFCYAQGRDVLYERDIRREPTVRVLGYFSIEEVYLRARVGEVPKARTVSAWCMWPGKNRREEVVYNVAQEAAAWLDRYGWSPCPSWKPEMLERPAERLFIVAGNKKKKPQSQGG